MTVKEDKDIVWTEGGIVEEIGKIALNKKDKKDGMVRNFGLAYGGKQGVK